MDSGDEEKVWFLTLSHNIYAVQYRDRHFILGFEVHTGWQLYDQTTGYEVVWQNKKFLTIDELPILVSEWIQKNY